MAKNKKNRNKVIKIPGTNGTRQVQVPMVQSKIDPNTAPLGSAFTTQDAQKLADAITSGVRQIFSTFNIRGFFVNFIVPVVEFRKDVPMPGGGTKDDFMLKDGINPALSSVGAHPPLMEAVQLVTPVLWKQAYGVEQQTTGPVPEPPAPPAQ